MYNSPSWRKVSNESTKVTESRIRCNPYNILYVYFQFVPSQAYRREVELYHSKIWIIVVSGIGSFLSAYALLVEIQRDDNASYKPFCDIHDSISCTKAFMSKWESKLTLPIFNNRLNGWNFLIKKAWCQREHIASLIYIIIWTDIIKH